MKVTRFGKSVPACAAFLAWTQGTLSEKLAAVREPCNPVERHFLLLSICTELYRRRHESPQIAALLVRYGRMHLAELPLLLPELERNDRENRAARGGSPIEYSPPHVPTVDHLTMALCEAGDYEGARAAYREAVDAGYLDERALAHCDALVEKRRKRFAKAAAAPRTPRKPV